MSSVTLPRSASDVEGRRDKLMGLHDQIGDLKATYDADGELAAE